MIASPTIINPKPLVSYLYATYNIGILSKNIIQASKFTDSYPIEICISDGGSSDSSLEQIRLLAPIVRILKSSSDASMYDAWNQGAKLCLGSYIAVLGADDIPCEQFLQFIINNVDLECWFASPPLIYGDIIRRYSAKHCSRQKSHAKSSLGSIFPRMDVPHPGALIRSDVYWQISYDIEIKLASDFDFMIGLASIYNVKSWLYVSLPQSVIGSGGVSNTYGALSLYLRDYLFIQKKRKIFLWHEILRIFLLKILYLLHIVEFVRLNALHRDNDKR